MKFEDALKIEGADSVGGQLIVNRSGKNILVGKNVQGTLIVEDTEEAKAIVFEATGVAVVVDPETPETSEPVTHEVKAADEVKTGDKLKK